MAAALTVRRLSTRAIVGDGAHAAAVTDRLTRACRSHLQPAIRNTLQPWIESGPDVWIVRRVDLSVITEAEAPPDALASSLAQSLARALAVTLVGDGDGVNAIRFPSRAACIARLVVDLAAGTAWTRWYHQMFDGWKMLSTSAAIRSALDSVPADGLEALRLLPDLDLRTVVECLEPDDEQRVLTAFVGMPDEAATGPAPDTSLADGVRLANRVQLQRGRALFVCVAARGPITPRVVAAASAVARMDPTPPTPEETRASVLESPAEAGTEAVAASEAPLPTPTRFGGTVLLFRELQMLPWSTWTKDWPVVGPGLPAARVLPWLVLGACTGPRADAFFADGLWRQIHGVSVSLDMTEISRWLRSVGEARRAALIGEARREAIPRRDRRWLMLPPPRRIGSRWVLTLAELASLVYGRFARRLPGFAQSSPDTSGAMCSTWTHGSTRRRPMSCSRAGVRRCRPCCPSRG